MIMNKDIKYAVLHCEKSTAQSLIKDTFTFLILALCVFVSKDSVAWTVISVTLFAVFGIGQIFDSDTKRFKTKAELQEWVDSL
jgi:hypothetical protein